MDDLSQTTEQTAPPKTAQDYIEELVKQARSAAGRLAILSTAVKDQALLAMADGLEAKVEEILASNEQDLDAVGKGKEQAALVDRLRLTTERIAEIAAGIREIAKLPDPLGEAPRLWRMPAAISAIRSLVRRRRSPNAA